jgi:RHS repeat-associated protein
MDGKMDEAALYPSSLSATAVANHAFQATKQYEALVLSTSPAGYWRLGESSGLAYDSTANSNDGTVTLVGGTRAAASLVPGESDGSIDFDGQDTQVVVPDDSTIQNIFDGGGTIEAWINPRSDGGLDDGHILRKDIWILWVDADDGTYYRLGFKHSFSTTSGWWYTDMDLPLNQPVHVAVTYNSDSVNNDPIVYIDGVPRTVGHGLTETSTPVGTRSTDVGDDLYISNRPCCGGDAAFDGLIDDVAVYPDALSAAAVKRHFGLGEQYDDLYRLTGVSYPDLGIAPKDTVGYRYDAVGNRLALTDNGETTVYSYDAADRLTSVTEPGQSPVTYTWDNNGNLTARGGDSFTWDAADRLTSKTVNSTTTNYTYNGDGLRETIGSSTETWDVNRAIPQVLGDGTVQYVYGVGRVSMRTAPSIEGDEFFYYTDGLGSTIRFGLGSEYGYDAFGGVRWETFVCCAGTAFKFAGEAEDTDGMQYLRARYYDTETGRFLSRDPLNAFPGWPGHPFVYVENDPMNYTDPYGLCAFGLIKGSCGSAAKHAGKAVVKAVETHALPALTQCAIWGLQAGIATASVGGAAVGCAAGTGAYIASQVFRGSPAGQCLSWGAAGASEGPWAVAAGCLAGYTSMMMSGDSKEQCAIWMTDGLIAGRSGAKVRTGVSACLAGILGDEARHAEGSAADGINDRKE